MDIAVRNEEDRARAIAALRREPLGNKGFAVTVKPITRSVSLAMRRKFEVVVSNIAAATGEDRDRMRTILKAKFIGTDIIEHDGKTYEVPISTTTLNAESMGNLISQIESWAIEHITGYGISG